MTGLLNRLEQATPEDFPYADVVAELTQVGKHFAPKDLLTVLDAVRRRVPAGKDGHPAAELARFLDCVLDKWHGRYDYVTYTGLAMLPLPGGEDPAVAASARDRLLLLLIADTLRFELAAERGQTAILPRLRPEHALVTKRCRHCLRSLSGQLGALKLTPADVRADPRAAAGLAWQAVERGMSASERRMLLVSMLPVDVFHDEYMFIRVLQSFETTFALLAVQLGAVIRTLSSLVDGGTPPGGQAGPSELMRGATEALRQSAPLFSLLATMQVDAFRLFRQFTEGASAIQSRGYKTMEALCRRPDPERLDSAAYRFVPEVRDLVHSGLPALEATVSRAREAGALSAASTQQLVAAMNGFAAALSQWRTTHYRLAVRMLGTAPGTGYTEGTPYLKSVLDIPVFTADNTKERFT